MSGTLKRADTLWPRATARSFDPDLAHVASAGHESSHQKRRSPGDPEARPSKLRRQWKKQDEAHEDHGSSLDRPIEDIPAPPSFKRTEAAPSNEEQSRDVVSWPKHKLHNRHMVPTAGALNQSIVITRMSVWDLYEQIEFCDNQGECSEGKSSVICRRKAPAAKEECLFVIKEQRWSGNALLSHCVKPQSAHLVDLQSAFCSGDILWTIYEEMDISLEQIFELDCDPWTVNPARKR